MKQKLALVLGFTLITGTGGLLMAQSRSGTQTGTQGSRRGTQGNTDTGTTGSQNGSGSMQNDNGSSSTGAGQAGTGSNATGMACEWCRLGRSRSQSALPPLRTRLAMTATSSVSSTGLATCIW